MKCQNSFPKDISFYPFKRMESTQQLQVPVKLQHHMISKGLEYFKLTVIIRENNCCIPPTLEGWVYIIPIHEPLYTWAQYTPT